MISMKSILSEAPPAMRHQMLKFANIRAQAGVAAESKQGGVGTDEEAVNVGVSNQVGAVLGADRTSVQDPHRSRDLPQ